MEESFYIDGLHKGNEEVFKLIFEKYHTRLCYFAGSLLPSSDAVEDVVQDAFIKLWQRRLDFHHLKAIKSFLYITVKNKSLNIYKHDKIVKKYEDLLPKEKSENEVIERIMEAEVLQKVHNALQKLPEGCRKIMYLSYFEEMKNKEVAAYLKVSINTVKTQKRRALQLLRSIMKVTSMFL